MTEREVIEVLKNFGLQAVAKSDGAYQTDKGETACLTAVSVLEKSVPRPIQEWRDELGDCLWWHFPVEEAPYCGTPIDEDWEYVNRDNYYTHFTELVIPKLKEN